LSSQTGPQRTESEIAEPHRRGICFEQFVSMADLMDPAKGYVVNDCMEIEAVVIVRIPEPFVPTPRLSTQ
jgi:hypothetical protein